MRGLVRFSPEPAKFRGGTLAHRLIRVDPIRVA